jgi:hypothetical protein
MLSPLGLTPLKLRLGVRPRSSDHALFTPHVKIAGAARERLIVVGAPRGPTSSVDRTHARARGVRRGIRLRRLDGFAAAPIAERDWGVIELDHDGTTTGDGRDAKARDPPGPRTDQ